MPTLQSFTERRREANRRISHYWQRNVLPFILLFRYNNEIVMTWSFIDSFEAIRSHT